MISEKDHTAEVVARTMDMVDPTMSVSDIICRDARISNPNSDGDNQRLINYLIKHNHWSPLDMVDITLHVTTTRDISRQLLRHRSFVFQEFSQRYSDDIEFAESTPPRAQHPTNRQASLPMEYPEGRWETDQDSVVSLCNLYYSMAIREGIAKEVARKLLPEGLTKTSLKMKGSVRSWVHYIQVRTDPTTQLEHRFLANQMANAISSVFPQILEFVHNDDEA